MMSPLWVILLISVSVSSSTSDDKITITTDLGDIIGNVKNNGLNGAPGKVYEFLGIQYGIAPIGNLRFRPSQLNTSWNTSIYDATTFGPMCIQDYTANYKMSEDCLFLNIWTPQINKSNLLPVMFWIHGGDMSFGSGSDPSYDGTNLVGNGKDFVYVSINYRLGPLGFLASQQLYQEDPNWKSYGGMNGIYDQIQALNWVKQYISGFGGDANQITIFGESSGGESICFLLISPKVPNDLFQRAIIESGACIGAWGCNSTQGGIKQTNQYLSQYGMSTNVTILRTYPATQFKFFNFRTSVDKLVIHQLPNITYSNLNGNVFNPTQLIMGFNSMDGTVGETPKTPQQYTNYIHSFLPNKTQQNLVENVYYPLSDFPAASGESSATIAWSSMNGDVCVACPTIQMMQQISKQKSNDDFQGYLYEFRGGGAPYYAEHASEIAFVFDHPSDVFSVPWNQKLSDDMLSAWTNFGKYGIPNVTVNGHNMEWTQFASNNGNVMIWDDNSRIIRNYPSTFRHNACEFWNNEVEIDVLDNICYDGTGIEQGLN